MGNGKIIGYRRVFDGGCDHCRIASQRLYYISTLMPMHENCNCGIAPVFEGEPHGLFHVKDGKTYKYDPELGSRLDQSIDPAELEDPGDLVGEDVIAEDFDEWNRTLSLDDAITLNEYGSTLAYSFNDNLRKHKDEVLENPRIGEEWISELVKALDELLQSLEHATMVHRGLNRPWSEIFGGEPEVGGIIEDNAYMSTTHQESLAKKYLGQKGGVLIDIIVPKGTKALWLSDEGLGSELVLARGTRLQITEVIDAGHVVCRVIG